MTTKAPSAVQEFSADTLEKIAYTSVATIVTVEPNDRNRLGYHVWRWLTEKQGTLQQAVAESGARLTVSHADAANVIAESLKKLGVSLS